MGSNPTKCSLTGLKKSDDGNQDAEQMCWMAIVVHGEPATRNVLLDGSIYKNREQLCLWEITRWKS